jgi:hypothetical protein
MYFFDNHDTTPILRHDKSGLASIAHDITHFKLLIPPIFTLSILNFKNIEFS